MKRGDIVTVAAQGDYGKPRPAVVIQANALNQLETESTILALMTSSIKEAPLLRLTIEPTTENGLHHPSQVMADKLLTIRRNKTRKPVGQLTDKQLVELNRLLALVIGIA